MASPLMVLESLKASDYLVRDSITAEVIDIRTLKPLDCESIVNSVGKTGRLLAVDGACHTAGFDKCGQGN